MPRDQVLQLRLTKAERKALDRAAKAERLSTGTWLRVLGLRAAEAQETEAANRPNGEKP